MLCSKILCKITTFMSENQSTKTLKFNFILILFGLILGLVVSEISLKILNLPKFYSAHSAAPQFAFKTLDNGDLLYVNAPSSNIEFKYDNNPRGYFNDNNAVYHKTNSLGFRGEEYTEEKDENTTRIAFIGDSFTFGEGVKDSDIFSNKLIEKLNSLNSKENTYESYNFGVGGYNTEQSVFLFKNLVHTLKPDIVFLGYTLNDAESKLFYVNKNANSVERRAREANIHEGLPDSKPPDTLPYIFRTTKLLWQVTNNHKITEQTIDYYKKLYDENNKNWRTTQNSLREFSEICKEKQIKCYFIMFPLLFELNENYPFHEIHSKVKAEIESKDIPIIDVLPSLLGKEYKNLWVHFTDQHPNELVHEIVAELLFKELK